MSRSETVILQALGCTLTLSKHLTEIREHSGATRLAFANKLGISTQRLANIEQGKARVLPKHAAQYAKILKESEEQFVRLALQDMIDKDELEYKVVLQDKHL
jgi:transcriptional regulator with XRE-family HTH domain